MEAQSWVQPHKPRCCWTGGQVGLFPVPRSAPSTPHSPPLVFIGSWNLSIAVFLGDYYGNSNVGQIKINQTGIFAFCEITKTRESQVAHTFLRSSLAIANKITGPSLITFGAFTQLGRKAVRHLQELCCCPSQVWEQLHREAQEPKPPEPTLLTPSGHGDSVGMLVPLSC